VDADGRILAESPHMVPEPEVFPSAVSREAPLTGSGWIAEDSSAYILMSA